MGILDNWRRHACRKHGHKPRSRVRHGIRAATSRDFRAVAVNVREESRICARCGLLLGAPIVVDGRSIQSLSLPSHLMDRLHEDGVLWD